MSTIVAELPKFKDKVMYISSSNSDTKLETSYVISSSFQGIVRLSPNNHNTYHENSDHQLSAEDEQSQKLLYSDAIKFDDEALAALKSDSDITRRMIIASESSGYLVNFRISDKDVEFDNLGIMGTIKTDALTVYSTNDTQTDSSFVFNGQRMPTKTGNSYQLQRLGRKVLDQDEKDSFEEILDYDIREVNVLGQGDNSQLLYTMIDSEDNRKLFYKQTKLFIQDAIMQALLSFQTIPTGSVHFVPVTVQQYLALTGNYRGTQQIQAPNVNFKYQSETIDEMTDPIIRDFLLCDGREYNAIDFPELAKTLWKENIQTWKKHDNIYPEEGDYNESEKEQYTFIYPRPREDGDIPNKFDSKHTFRVPDLRHMFIGSVLTHGMEKMVQNQPSKHVSCEKVKTGYYFPDNLPTGTKRFKSDDHRHFVAYGTYNQNLFSTNRYFNTNFVNSYIKPVSNGVKQLQPISKSVEKNGLVGTMYLTNHPYYMGHNFTNGFSHRYKNNPQKGHVGTDSVSAHMFASVPHITATANEQVSKETQKVAWQQPETSQYVGHSSPSILSVSEPDASENVLHGHENSPKYFAMLPLIKI